ncbi:hypothetical protein N9948_00560 [bacterium]|nr:hypothetical protein [bacterium]
MKKIKWKPRADNFQNKYEKYWDSECGKFYIQKHKCKDDISYSYTTVHLFGDYDYLYVEDQGFDWQPFDLKEAKEMAQEYKEKIQPNSLKFICEG